MIDKWSVVDAVKLGYAYALDDSGLLPFCEAACRELTLRLREGANEADIRLINAAAAMANYAMALKALAADDGVTAFKAGDVSIKRSENGSGIADAIQRRNDAMLAALPLIRDDGFLFSGVPI